MAEDFVTQTESTIRWSSHATLHEVIEKGNDQEIDALSDRINDNLEAHERVHQIHADAHEREHELSEAAISKAEQSIDRRLEGMNEFREQLNRQANTFLTRDVFEKYTNDLETKTELALSSMNEKNDTIVQAMLNRHDSDFNSLKDSIQAEKEIRKTFEGSMSTWKWIASFLGASGVAGVILLFATRT